jgi:putative ABC transport system substrate-binding protein
MQFAQLRRRDFISLLGGAAAAWPVAGRGQQRKRMRRVGMMLPPEDAEGQARVGAFLQELGRLGWAIGRNLRIDIRWGEATAADFRRRAAELAALAPDVILAHGAGAVGTLLQATSSVPIVFAVVSDPVADGLVENLARPVGNATGFMAFEYTLSGKWLELLKQIAPSVMRAAVFRNAAFGPGTSHYAVIQAAASSLKVEVTPASMGDASGIERAVATLARLPNGGLIVTPGAPTILYRDLIIKLAAEHRLPTVYYERNFVAAGGLISYGPSFIDQYRQAAGYVDCILKGETPADLPVQSPTKYELAINLKTAKALGLEVPATLLATADEVIE